MSGIFSRGHQSTAGDNKSTIAPSHTGQTEDNQNAPQTPQNRGQSAPRTMPEMPDVPESSLGSSSGENEGEMVPAAGRINESGEVIDDDGNAIGRVTTDGEASRFAGYVVTQEGDILDQDGGVVGRAEPLDDVASNLNYTTKSARGGATPEGGEEEHGDDELQQDQQEQSQGGGLGGALGGVANTAGSAVSGVTGGLGKATKGVTDTVGGTAKGATDTVGEATGTEDVTGAVGDTVKGVTDTTGDTAKGVTDTTGDVAEGVTNTAGDTAEGVTGAADDTAAGATEAADDTAPDVTGAADDTAADVTRAADDTAAGATEAADDTAEGVADAAKSTTKDAHSTVDDATEQVPKDITDTTDAVEHPEGVADDAGDAVEDATQGVKEAPDTAIEDAVGSAGEAAEDVPKDVEQEAEGVAEAAPSGVGSGEQGSQAHDLAEQVPEPMAEVPSLSPSIKKKVAALFDGPFTIADGGKVTDQSGKILGKLASGSDIQDLVGKQVKGIDEQGNLLGENDTVIGKVDIAPDSSMAERIKEEVPEAAEQIDALQQQEVPEPEQLQEDVGDVEDQVVKIPSFTSSVAGKVIDMFESPFNIAENGQVTDQNGKVLGKLSKTSDIQDLVGKEVTGIDGKGNLFGDNGSVIGKVDIAPEGTIAERVKEQVPEAAERLDALEEQKAQAQAPIKIPSFTSSVAGKVINMFDGPFNIAENGQVTDQNGKVLGKLAEGQDFQSLIGKDIKGIDQHGNLLGDNDTELGKVDLVPEGSIVERIKEEVPEAAERLDAIEAAKQQEAEVAGPDLSILEGLKINKMGNVVDSNGNPIGRVKSGDLKRLVGKSVDKNGKIWDDRGNVIGEVEPFEEALKNESSPFEDFPDATVDKFGKVIFDGRQVGVVIGDDWQKMIGKKVDADGDILDKNGNVIGHAERKEEEEPEEPEEEQIDYSMLKGKKVNKLGNVVDDKGQVWGHVVQGVVKLLNGKSVGDNGQIFNDAGQVMGKAEPVPDSEREEAKEPAPFEDFPDAVVGENGDIIAGGEKIGIVVEGDAKKLKGKSVDADGDILDRAGNKLGRAERWEAEPEPEAEVIDMSALAGKRINKAGNAVDSRGDIYGRVIEGSLTRLVGKMCDKNGFIRNEGGDVIGKCELIPEAEREGMKEGPFTELSGCTVNKEGKVVTPGGDVVGRLVSGDAKMLAGRPVDDDGDICDKNGNVLGHAERWEEPEVEKEVNPMSGRKVNREGNVIDENGDIMGKLTAGELSQCAGKKIDDDGDVVDQKGTAIGHCSLLEEIPAETKEINPMSGRRVNREGNVVDENGDLMGKLTSGELSQCAGKKIDDDGDVVDQKGAVLGHCSLLEEIPREKTPEPEPEGETEEERQARLKKEQDAQIAKQITYCLTQSLDKIKPICRMIVERINQEEAKREEDRDEEELVKQVRPLIEEGGKILTEANGVIRGLDPDGRISAQAQHHSAGNEATPEEYHLAELLKELTGTVTETIENAKRKLENLPKAKKGINPLWGLLSEPLFQIIAAVGLLLSGVLGLVGKLLNGLGLGGLVNNLLGGLGLTKVLDGLGLGSVLAPITGSKKK